MKRELSALYKEIVALDLSEDHDLVTDHTVLETLLFKCAHQVKKLLNQSSCSRFPTHEKGSKLPKLEVPIFDGDVLHWMQFWEQFSVSIHQ